MFCAMASGATGATLTSRPLTSQRHVDQATLIHHLQDATNQRDHRLVDKTAERRAQVLRELLHTLNHLGGRSCRHVVRRQALIKQDALDVHAQVVDHDLTYVEVARAW
jgi:hypothetical protein